MLAVKNEKYEENREEKNEKYSIRISGKERDR